LVQRLAGCRRPGAFEEFYTMFERKKLVDILHGSERDELAKAFD
jgi:hypothetical protein